MSKLQQLLEQKRLRVEARKSHRPVVNVPRDDRTVRWDRNSFHILAEIKRSSLSAGLIRAEVDIHDLAVEYATAGVSAVSVLTEEQHFRGSLEDLSTARKAIPLPILQKDFIIDEYQILEAKDSGADFVLLIARLLSPIQLNSFLKICDQIGINAIVEITCSEDLDRIHCPVKFLGVNARDLETLEVDTGKFRELRSLLPDAFLVAESGIHSIHSLREVIDLGYHGALIGEHFLRQRHPGEEAAGFVAFAKRAMQRPNVKICGVTAERDVVAAMEAGIDALGFIFAESPRSIQDDVLERLRGKIPEFVLAVGVFRGQSQEEIRARMEHFHLDVAQIYVTDVTGSTGSIHHEKDKEWTVWDARVVRAGSELSHLPEGKILWDLKTEEKELAGCWKQLSSRPVFALAGGLHAENVSQAIQICEPQWIDVARGVEKEPGVKDEQKIHVFLKKIRECKAS